MDADRGRDKLTEYFAGELLKARKAAGLSQTVTAKRAEISLRQYQYFESGKCTPNLDTLCRIAVALGMSPSSLIPNKSLTLAFYR